MKAALIVGTAIAVDLSVPEGLICNADADKCAADLNVHYNGFDENDEKSAMGVAIRGRARFDDNAEWFFCTGECFQSDPKDPPFPDCYTAAGLINHKIMQTEDGKIPSASNSKSKNDAYFARYPVLVVFQPINALTRFTKCAWQFDGSAFTRSNGGCGMGATGQTCKDPLSAYGDKCPDDPTKWADETCPTTMQAYCDKQTPAYSTNCFWKGPAWASPVNPGAKPDFDFSDFDQNNEIRKMVVNRLGHQDGETTDKLPLLEYWDEITMDGRIIQHFIDTDGIASVVAAIAFTKGNSDAIDQMSQVEAQKFVDYYSKHSKVDIPLLALDTAWKIGSDGGPFTVVKPIVAVTVSKVEEQVVADTCDGASLCPGYTDGDCSCTPGSGWYQWTCTKRQGASIPTTWCSIPGCDCNTALEEEPVSKVEVACDEGPHSQTSGPGSCCSYGKTVTFGPNGGCCACSWGNCASSNQAGCVCADSWGSVKCGSSLVELNAPANIATMV